MPAADGFRVFKICETEWTTHMADVLISFDIIAISISASAVLSSLELVYLYWRWSQLFSARAHWGNFNTGEVLIADGPRFMDSVYTYSDFTFGVKEDFNMSCIKNVARWSYIAFTEWHNGILIHCHLQLIIYTNIIK